ncbi:hypothetical protein HMPREF3214_01668 [Alloscardovia omnicolens]|nr:hypothetical protein HMPREF3214_01668 [Alloscardovia omnicolens]
MACRLEMHQNPTHTTHKGKNMTEWINTTASVLTCISIMAAVIGWYITRFQMRDAHLIFMNQIKWSYQGGTKKYPTIEIQNIGTSGAIIGMIGYKNISISDRRINDSSEKDTVLLMPGERYTVNADWIGNDAHIYVLYSSQRNVNIAHVQQFDVNAVLPGVLSAHLEQITTHKGIIRWVKSFYREGELFTKNGPTHTHRRILLGLNEESPLLHAMSWIADNSSIAKVTGTHIGEIDVNESQEQQSDKREEYDL